MRPQLAPAAAMRAVVQRVTRASVTGQSGGAAPGGAAPDPAPAGPAAPATVSPRGARAALSPAARARARTPAGLGAPPRPQIAVLVTGPSASLAVGSSLSVQDEHTSLFFLCWSCVQSGRTSGNPQGPFFGGVSHKHAGSISGARTSSFSTLRFKSPPFPVSMPYFLWRLTPNNMHRREELLVRVADADGCGHPRDQPETSSGAFPQRTLQAWGRTEAFGVKFLSHQFRVATPPNH